MLWSYLAGMPQKVAVRHSTKAKRLSLRISIGGLIELVIPDRVSQKQAIDFLKNNQTWLDQKVGSPAKSGNSDLAEESTEHFYNYKQAALDLVLRRIPELNQDDFSYNLVRVKRMKTRWGSCSTKGNLNFNYKILFLPSELQDYLIVHELCHLKHPNHSRAFWSEVANHLPGAQQLDRQLKTFSRLGYLD